MKLQSSTIIIGITSSITKIKITMTGTAILSFDKVKLFKTNDKHCCSKAPEIPLKYRLVHQIRVARVSLRILILQARDLYGLPEYINDITIIITTTLVATKKFKTVHSIEKALAERQDPRYSPIIKTCKMPRTLMIKVISCLPLPTQTSSKKLACPKLKRAKCYQNSIKNAVITINSGIIINRNSLLGKSSISSVLVDPVMAPLIADIIVSSAIPIRYMIHAVMKLVARKRPVTNKQM